MDFSKLFSKAKELASDSTTRETVKKIANSDAVKKAVKKVSNNKNLKNAQKTVTKAAKAVGIDVGALALTAMKNKAVVDVLVKLGLKKDSDPASGAVQKLVGSLKNSLNKVSGVKLEDKSFSTAVTKILGVDKVKDKLEDVAGKGVPAFIKKAVSEYIS
ncbi:MAG: hypothetical protein IKI71_01320 [Lachnospiraceae bacterium]|nr:hypothetical protein [Lachnospiraceae bacterium]